MAAFAFYWKLSQSPTLVDKQPEPPTKEEAEEPKLPLQEAADWPTVKIQQEARKSARIFFMASLLKALQDRIDTIAFESEYTFRNCLENGIDVKTEAITDHIRKYLVENADAADWLFVSDTTGFVPRTIPNDGFAGFEYRVIKVRQIDRLKFMATRFKKLIDDYCDNFQS
ncbi:MAG TPA: hypothetical protein VGR14_03230 [Verrucomicrobiae bacterium]|nr:hypothetical protein [Verrucomicrobiae bacterium]